MKCKRYDIDPVPYTRVRGSAGGYYNVGRYTKYKENLRWLRFDMPKRGSRIVFDIPMPKSWSEKKKQAMEGQPHEATPDLDNLLKAVMDVANEDKDVSSLSGLEKRWARKGAIEVWTET